MAVNFIMMGIVVGIMLGLVITIGFVVYKDAKALGLNAILWTIAAIIIPNFIGVIIYLVVRSTTPKKVTCSICQTKIKEDYNVCPECGSSFVVFCKGCKRPVEPELKICPYCGESMEYLELPKAIKIFPKTNIVRAIGVILAIFLGTIIIVVVATFGIGNIAFRTNYAPKNIAIMNVENNIGNQFKSSFFYKDGTDTKRFNIKKDSRQLISGEVYVEEGSIRIEVIDNEGNSIFTQEFTPQEEAYAVAISLDKTDVFYKVHMVYNKAKGHVDLKAE